MEDEQFVVDVRMKSARYYLVLLSVLALAHVVGLNIFLVQKQDTLDRSKMEKVQIGMSYQEIVKILKCLPGDYSDGQFSLQFYSETQYRHFMREGKMWECNGAQLYVIFDNDNTAIGVKMIDTIRSENKSLFYRLKTKLGF